MGATIWSSIRRELVCGRLGGCRVLLLGRREGMDGGGDQCERQEPRGHESPVHTSSQSGARRANDARVLMVVGGEDRRTEGTSAREATDRAVTPLRSLLLNTVINGGRRRHEPGIYAVGAVRSVIHYLGGCVAALLALLWRITSRRRVIDDPRPALRAEGRGYIYALLHAHQLSALVVNDDRQMAAMVSRSADGNLLVPILRARRVRPVRGSTRTRGRDKGGRPALDQLAVLLRAGVPALLAVDGPLGPRNHVHRGVVDLARETAAAILPVVVIPSRRWILSRTWDRMQNPKPFCTLRLAFDAPIHVDAGEPVIDACARVTSALDELERRHDPAEARVPPPRAPARARLHVGGASGGGVTRSTSSRALPSRRPGRR